ncbi:EST1 DNA bind and PIN 4 domain containing protein [Trichuris trichiura]|uniref:EST1 DNA bind and PIN 4 domain containing protein n=1 Tax=Trichuris trichiura TaxID=36087 RepID=A0A077ZBV4_TRITR|nr:EST1 DNA bind and PIN 4 domain containing protein [Trichuris trichiura]
MRDACETVMLGSTNELGRKAEELMWRKCYYEHIQMLRQRKNELCTEAWGFVQDLITAACGYYLTLIEKIKCHASDELRNSIKATPIHFRWCSPDLKADSLDTWVLDTIYRCEFEDADLKTDCGDAERFYCEALSLKPKSGITYNQLGTLYVGVNCNLESVYYYFRCICSEESFSGSESNLLDLLQENELSYYRVEKKQNAEACGVVGMWTPKLFVLSSLRLFRFFYEKSSANEKTLMKYCDENLCLLQACLSMSLIGRLSVSGGVDSTGKTVVKVFSLLALLLKWLDKNDKPKVEAISHWMGSAFSFLVEHSIEAINRCFESHRKGTVSRTAETTLSQTSLDSSAKTLSDQIECSSVDENMLSAPERKGKECNREAVSEKKGSVAKEPVTDVDSTTLTPVMKLELLSDLDWPIVLRVFCSWLRTDDILISYVGQHSPGIWGELATMLNLLPTDDELKAIIEQDKELAGEMEVAITFPLSTWCQTLPLDEDIYLYDILGTMFTEESTKAMSFLQKKDACFIRICCLQSFGHHLVKMKVPDFSYDEEQQSFIAPFNFKAAQKLNRAKKQNLMKRMAQLKLKTDCARYRRIVERPMFLVPDAASLCHNLNMVQELLHCGDFVIVISITVVDELDLWKKSMHQARRASRWLESELVNEAEHLELQQRDVRIRLCPEVCLSAPLEMVEACAYLRQKPGNESFTIALLTHHGAGAPPFEYMGRLIEEHRLTGVVLRNIKEFFDEWTISKLEND